ncbi:MAG TPA: fumarylacetoacetase [Clostridiales bacterium]|nr:fumarylacetoacetase [Clostridiales bacterium]
MRFYTVKVGTEEKPAVGYAGHKRIYLTEDWGFSFEDMNDLIRRISKEQMDALRRPPADVPGLDIDRTEWLAPIPRPLQDVIYLGVNYADHARESRDFDHQSTAVESTYPVFFSKRVSETVAPFGSVPLYSGLVDSLDYEVELCVVIGSDAKNVPMDRALDYVFGYTILNDISARNIQMRHNQWYFGKSFDGFTPLGPCIVSADEIEDPGQLDLECRVNGELRQRSNTRMLITTIPQIIEELSAGMTLKAGTLIATGTPAGVAFSYDPPKYLRKGDAIECRIERIGALINRVGE